MMKSENEMTARQAQAALTREKIFDAAVSLFNEKPFERVTIREICKKADVAVGTFYIYYASKYAILSEFYRKADEFFAQMDISDKNGISALQKILELIKVQLQSGKFLYHKIDFLKRLYIYQMTSDNGYFLSEERPFYIQMHKIVQSGQKSGEIRTDMTSREISWRILRFSRGILFDWCLRGGKYDLDKVAVREMRVYIESFMRK